MPACMLRNTIFTLPPNAAALLASNPRKSKSDVASGSDGGLTFCPGVMRRFGLDYEALTPIKPDLIYCAISGYGQTGPSAALPAYAPVIHAASGYDLAHMAYQGEARRPDYCGIYIADVLTGTYAFGAITAALYQREMTGEGQMIDVSMLESMLSLTLSEIQAAQFSVAPPGRPIFG